jgi:hypothetical protein
MNYCWHIVIVKLSTLKIIKVVVRRQAAVLYFTEIDPLPCLFYFATFHFDHFCIHCSRPIIDSTSSCPLFVNLYSTRGGISLYLCLSNILLFSNSLSLLDNVLVLKPFIVCLNCLCLTGFVVQHNGISISSVPLFVINFLNFAVFFGHEKPEDIGIFRST